ncbi:hypothetical protein RTCIAT899_CH11480 [Rhizobium tropici CIAT 899]|nr:hypothetical protein RTCIAT899_CH11480 [Rhizobium tropici CIAT 899]
MISHSIGVAYSHNILIFTHSPSSSRKSIFIKQYQVSAANS